MCISVRVIGRSVGEYGTIGSVAELANFLGSREAIVWAPDCAPTEGESFDSCLCPVNVAKTMRRAGYKCWWPRLEDDRDSMELQCAPSPLVSGSGR